MCDVIGGSGAPRGTPRLRRSDLSVVFLNGLLVLIGCVVAVWPSVFSLFNLDPVKVGFAFASLAACWWILSVLVFSREFFQPVALMVLSAVVFNLGLFPILLFSPSITWGRFAAQFSDETLVVAASLAVAGIAAFHSGGILGCRLPTQSIPGCAATDRARSKAAVAVGWFFSTIGILATLGSAGEIKRRLGSEGYAGTIPSTTLETLQDILVGLQDLVIIGSFLLLLGPTPSRGRVIFGTTSLSALCVVRILIGDRSGAILPALGLLWILDRTGRISVSRTHAVVALVILLIVSPIISDVRQSPLAGVFEVISDLLDGVSVSEFFVSGLEEYGSSVTTICYTIDLVPQVRRFEYGLGYIRSGVYAIPNRLTGGVFPEFGTPAVWLTQEVAPKIAAIGGGLGFSFIAEAYLQGGIAAVVLSCLFFGYMLGRLERHVTGHPNVAVLLLGAVVIAFGLKIPRGVVSELVRPVVWYWGMSLILIIGLTMLRRRAPVGYRGGRFGQTGLE